MMHQLTHRETEWTARTFPLIIACDNWRDPRNVGMAFRLADAFGVQELWLGGESPVPPNRKISRAARSTDAWVPFREVADLPAALREARAEGWRVLALEITSESHSIFEWDFPLEDRLVIVVGAENEGVSPDVLAEVEACGHVPMYGRNSSLNVVTALAIGLAEYSRQQIKRGG